MDFDDFGDLSFGTESNEPCVLPLAKLPEYKPKYCPVQWYNNDEEMTTDIDNSIIIKYKADMYYYKENYSTALLHYKHLLEILPVTYSQLKREIIDSIIRCCIHCGFGEDGIKWGEQLIISNTKDHSIWQLLANCHQQYNDSNHIQEEVYCRLKCVLYARHYRDYWIQLYLSLTRLSNCTDTINNNLLEDISQLFRPYFNKRRLTTTNNEQFELFINSLTTPMSLLSSEEHLVIVKVATVCSLIRIDQLLKYSLSQASPSTDATQLIPSPGTDTTQLTPSPGTDATQLTLSPVTDTTQLTPSPVSPSTDITELKLPVNNNDYCTKLKYLIIQYMQTPSEIDI